MEEGDIYEDVGTSDIANRAVPPPPVSRVEVEEGEATSQEQHHHDAQEGAEETERDEAGNYVPVARRRPTYTFKDKRRPEGYRHSQDVSEMTQQQQEKPKPLPKVAEEETDSVNESVTEINNSKEEREAQVSQESPASSPPHPPVRPRPKSTENPESPSKPEPPVTKRPDKPIAPRKVTGGLAGWALNKRRSAAPDVEETEAPKPLTPKAPPPRTPGQKPAVKTEAKIEEEEKSKAENPANPEAKNEEAEVSDPVAAKPDIPTREAPAVPQVPKPIPSADKPPPVPTAYKPKPDEPAAPAPIPPRAFKPEGSSMEVQEAASDNQSNPPLPQAPKPRGGSTLLLDAVVDSSSTDGLNLQGADMSSESNTDQAPVIEEPAPPKKPPLSLPDDQPAEPPPRPDTKPPAQLPPKPAGAGSDLPAKMPPRDAPKPAAELPPRDTKPSAKPPAKLPAKPSTQLPVDPVVKPPAKLPAKPPAEPPRAAKSPAPLPTSEPDGPPPPPRISQHISDDTLSVQIQDESLYEQPVEGATEMYYAAKKRPRKKQQQSQPPKPASPAIVEEVYEPMATKPVDPPMVIQDELYEIMEEKLPKVSGPDGPKPAQTPNSPKLRRDQGGAAAPPKPVPYHLSSGAKEDEDEDEEQTPSTDPAKTPSSAAAPDTENADEPKKMKKKNSRGFLGIFGRRKSSDPSPRKPEPITEAEIELLKSITPESSAVGKAQASVTYESMHPSQLSLVAGETIEILQLDGPVGKWVGRNDSGDVGFVKCNNVAMDPSSLKGVLDAIPKPTKITTTAEGVPIDLRGAVVGVDIVGETKKPEDDDEANEEGDTLGPLPPKTSLHMKARPSIRGPPPKKDPPPPPSGTAGEGDDAPPPPLQTKKKPPPPRRGDSKSIYGDILVGTDGSMTPADTTDNTEQIYDVPSNEAVQDNFLPRGGSVSVGEDIGEMYEVVDEDDPPPPPPPRKATMDNIPQNAQNDQDQDVYEAMEYNPKAPEENIDQLYEVLDSPNVPGKEYFDGQPQQELYEDMSAPAIEPIDDDLYEDV